MIPSGNSLDIVESRLVDERLLSLITGVGGGGGVTTFTFTLLKSWGSLCSFSTSTSTSYLGGVVGRKLLNGVGWMNPMGGKICVCL